MLSLKLNVLYQTLFPGIRLEKFFHKLGLLFFSRQSFQYQNPIISSKLNALSHNSVPSGQICKIPSQTGGIFQFNHFEYQQSYVIFKIEHSLHISVYLNNLELTVLYTLKDFFKDQIDMCCYSLLLVNSIFCCELHFLTFSCVC